MLAKYDFKHFKKRYQPGKVNEPEKNHINKYN
jgi:hypothetical protein